MNNEPLLSLCIPTNGIVEWVVPVIESIYGNEANTEEFEVVITDNGSNIEFENLMVEYQKCHANFVYAKTDAKLFQNQIEAFKLANGQLIRFVNHRMTLLSNSLVYLINFAKENFESKPTVFFSNGALGLKSKIKHCRSFDEYVNSLSYFSSWSAGTTIWKSELEQMDLNINSNSLFPHTDVIFNNRSNIEYIIDDTILMNEIPVDATQKGDYDLFDAFAVQYPAIIEKLYKSGDISKQTFRHVLNKNSCFVGGLYLDYMIKNKPCSYFLGGYKKATGVYYSDVDIKFKAFFLGIKRILKRLLMT